MKKLKIFIFFHADKIDELLGDFGNDDSFDNFSEEGNATPKPKKSSSKRSSKGKAAKTVAPIKLTLKKKTSGRRKKTPSVCSSDGILPTYVLNFICQFLVLVPGFAGIPYYF